MADTNEQQVVDTAAAQTQIDPNETAEQKYQRLYGQQQPQTPQVVQAQLPPEVLTTLQSMQSELQELKSKVSAPGAKDPAAQAAWVDKIRQQDYAGAEQVIIDRTLETLQPKLQEQLHQVQQKAYNDALSAAQVTTEMDRYLSKVRAEHPEILPFERYLQAPIAERVQLAHQAGRVRSQQDFVREYRAAVDGEVEALRTHVLALRGQGKDEALTRTSDLSRSTVLTPQAVQSTRQDQQGSQQQTQGETTDDYFANRRAWENRVHGRG